MVAAVLWRWLSLSTGVCKLHPTNGRRSKIHKKSKSFLLITSKSRHGDPSSANTTHTARHGARNRPIGHHNLPVTLQRPSTPLKRATALLDTFFRPPQSLTPLTHSPLQPHVALGTTFVMTDPTPASPPPSSPSPNVAPVKTEPTHAPAPPPAPAPASPASSTSRKGKGGRRAANPHLSEEERRRERILKNRESAMKSLQKKKRYTEDLEHRALALASRNAELKEKIRLQLTRLQAMGIVAVPGVGVFGGPPSFQRPHITSFPADDWLPDFTPPANPPLPQQQPETFHFNPPVPVTAPGQPLLSQGEPFVLDGDARQSYDLQHMTCTQ